eukprot:g17355.t1
MQDTTAWDTEEQGWALLPCLPHPAMRMSVKHVGRFIPVKSSDDSSYKDGKGFWETKDVQMGNRLSKMKFKSRGKAQTFISSGKASRRAFDTLASDHNSGLIDWHESEGGVAETRRLEEAKNEHEEEEVEGQKDQEDQEDQEEEHKEEEEDEGDERHGDGSEKAREKIGRQSTGASARTGPSAVGTGAAATGTPVVTKSGANSPGQANRVVATSTGNKLLRVEAPQAAASTSKEQSVGQGRPRCLDAFVVALNQALGERNGQWYTSFLELQLVSLDFCRACRGVPIFCVKRRRGG